ncbi:MAG: DUF2271 domain-containing protein [Treponema sp.]|jgi:hypothetical protein|nr:DUF2271 domain-containing protein [Treponema sp.]
MKKKIVIIVLAAFVLLGGVMFFRLKNPLNAGIQPLQAAQKQMNGNYVEISFSYTKLSTIASNQFAIWIEDMDGRHVKTLYATRFTGLGGYRRRPKSLPLWVSTAKPDSMPKDEIDAFTGATPKTGQYFIYWDFTDNKGRPVTGTQYRYVFEGTMYNDDNVHYSGIIFTDNEKWEDIPTPTYSKDNSDKKSMLVNVKTVSTK